MATPYTLEINDPYSYSFVSDQGLKYLVYFKSNFYLFEDYPLIHSFIYDFNIEVVEGNPEVALEDPRISHTIFEAFVRFFSSEENVAVYVCDPSDLRHEARNRKFDIWFFRHNDGSIIKKNSTIFVDNNKIHNSILVHKNNYEKDEIIRAFDELNQQMDK